MGAVSERPVILARNETNRGICSQINAGIERTSGELVMLANADDIYPPGYVSRMVAAWQSAMPRPTVIWAVLEQIDADGQSMHCHLKQKLRGDTLFARVRTRCEGPGATGLFLDRRVFTKFGPLPDNLMLEDACLNLRAFLLGEPKRIAEPWVRYRVHNANISQSYSTAGAFEDWAERRRVKVAWHMHQGHRAFVEMLRDMHQRPAEGFDQDDLKKARWVAVEKIAETAILADYYADDRVSDGARWAMLGRLAKLQIKLVIKRWLPFIERRNLRWEYRQYQRSKRG